MPLQSEVNKFRIYGSGDPWTNWQIKTTHDPDTVKEENYFGNAHTIFLENDLIDVLSVSKNCEGKTLLHFFVTKVHTDKAVVETKLMKTTQLAKWGKVEEAKE